MSFSWSRDKLELNQSNAQLRTMLVLSPCHHSCSKSQLLLWPLLLRPLILLSMQLLQSLLRLLVPLVDLKHQGKTSEKCHEAPNNINPYNNQYLLIVLQVQAIGVMVGCVRSHMMMILLAIMCGGRHTTLHCRVWIWSQQLIHYVVWMFVCEVNRIASRHIIISLTWERLLHRPAAVNSIWLCFQEYNWLAMSM